jgi:hypothetical protein
MQDKRLKMSDIDVSFLESNFKDSHINKNQLSKEDLLNGISRTSVVSCKQLKSLIREIFNNTTELVKRVQSPRIIPGTSSLMQDLIDVKESLYNNLLDYKDICESYLPRIDNLNLENSRLSYLNLSSFNLVEGDVIEVHIKYNSGCIKRVILIKENVILSDKKEFMFSINDYVLSIESKNNNIIDYYINKVIKL